MKKQKKMKYSQVLRNTNKKPRLRREIYELFGLFLSKKNNKMIK
jgi:hypothetical protein